MPYSRKLLSRKRLEILLQKVQPFIAPNPVLEQYPLAAKDAATLLSLISNTFNDIQQKLVGDLGCGTGILAIGIALLGAKRVVGVEIDQKQLDIAIQNADNLHVLDKIEWLNLTIEDFSKPLDIIIQNPPFGIQQKDRGMDAIFLKQAVLNAKVVYSLHKSAIQNQKYLTKIVQQYGGIVDSIIPLQITIPHIFNFHQKKTHPIKVDLYRILVPD